MYNAVMDITGWTDGQLERYLDSKRGVWELVCSLPGNRIVMRYCWDG
jgi:hypothetical protein